jgi:hypothetical protein
MGAPRGNKNAAGKHNSSVNKRSSVKRIKSFVSYQTRKQNKNDKFGNSQTLFFSRKENVGRIKSGSIKARKMFPKVRKHK